jgi:hypothetical protein
VMVLGVGERGQPQQKANINTPRHHTTIRSHLLLHRRQLRLELGLLPGLGVQALLQPRRLVACRLPLRDQRLALRLHARAVRRLVA